MNRQARVALCITCWSLATPAAADAARPPIVVVPVVDGFLPVANAQALTGPIEAALVAAGEHVLVNNDASDRVREYSSEPAELGPDTVTKVKVALQAAQAALADKPSVPVHVLQEFSAAQLDRAARAPSVATQFEAICLTELEYELRGIAPGDGHEQARLCESLFPALQANPAVYPPEVLSELARAGRRSVRVEGPPGCEVLLNGRDVGAVPATFSVFPVSARVQLLCDGRPTRVHLIDLAKHDRVSIDPSVDAATHTEHGLYLTGRSAPLATVAQWLGARVVPLRVSVIDGRIRVQLMAAASASETTLRTLWYDLYRGYVGNEVAAAVAQLIHAPIPPAVDPLDPSVSSQPDAPAAGSSFPTGPVVIAGTGVAMLVGGLVTGLLGHARDADVRHFAQACPAPCSPTAEQRTQVEHLKSQVSALYTTTNVLVAVGGAATAAGIAWFLLQPSGPAREKSVSVQPFVSQQSAGTRVMVHF